MQAFDVDHCRDQFTRASGTAGVEPGDRICNLLVGQLLEHIGIARIHCSGVDLEVDHDLRTERLDQ